ncbi:uncharacterized protein [Ovis canadensis]|uniref:uncharacterized protein isoform X1 n=1 Tax=Ovis canadensis TaxID=37174 RepID=UPI003750BA02
MAALLVQEDERESPLLRCQILPRRASRPVLLPSILSAPVATPKLPRPCGCGNATSSAASWYLEGGCPWTFRRRPALKMRPWHLVSANLRNLKIGYPCSLRFTCDESYTVHLFFSTKSRLGGLQGAGPSSQLLSRARCPGHVRSQHPSRVLEWRLSMVCSFYL